jgi:PEP-CTERM motif
MRSFIKSAVGLAVLILQATGASAAPIIYNANILAGPSGSVTGTFTTDGTIGAITGANFIAWDIVISGDDRLGHTVSESLTNLNSGVFSGSEFIGGSGIVGSTTGLVASATQITFDFSNPAPSFLLFQKSFGSGTGFFCTATGDNTNLCHAGFGLVPTNTDADGTFAGQGSTTNGGSAPLGAALLAEAAVPEPATWAMMLAGFSLVGGALRRGRPTVRLSYTG